MIQRIEIVNKLGLHARAAAKLVSTASAFSAEIMARRTDSEDAAIDCKSIMAVMMLAAAKGSILEFSIEGSDETQAWQAVADLINRKFDESE